MIFSLFFAGVWQQPGYSGDPCTTPGCGFLQARRSLHWKVGSRCLHLREIQQKSVSNNCVLRYMVSWTLCIIVPATALDAGRIPTLGGDERRDAISTL